MKKKALVPVHIKNWKALQAEFIGAFFLTFVTILSVIYRDLGHMTDTGVAMAHSVVILLLMWFMYDVSGAHFNPAITLALIVVKKIDWIKGFYYTVAQFLGAITAALFIYLQISTHILDQIKNKSKLGIPYPKMDEIKKFDAGGGSGNLAAEFLGEVLGNFLMIYIYMSLVANKSKTKSTEIGIMAFSFSIFAITLTVGELSGPCLNPARSIAPSIIIGEISKNQFYQIFGPIIGSVFGSVLYSWLYIDEEDDILDDNPSEPSKLFLKK